MNNKKVLAIILLITCSIGGYMFFNYEPLDFIVTERDSDLDEPVNINEPVSAYADNITHKNYSTEKFNTAIANCVIYYSTPNERQNAIELILRHTSEILIKKYKYYLNGGYVNIDSYFKELDSVTTQMNSYDHQSEFIQKVKKIKAYQNQINWITSAEMEEGVNKLISMSIQDERYKAKRKTIIGKIERIKKGIFDNPLNNDKLLVLLNDAFNTVLTFETKANQFHDILDKHYEIDTRGFYNRKPSTPIRSGPKMNVLKRRDYSMYLYYRTIGNSYINDYSWNL